MENTNPRRGVTLAAFGVLLTLLIVVGGLIIFPKVKARWTAPLGPALDLPTYTPTAASLATPQGTVVALASGNRTPTHSASTATAASGPTAVPPTATTAPTPTKAPLCGGPPVMTVLGVGADNRDNTYLYGLGDTIKIARIDFVTPKVTVLSIPRDLWVEIPGISDHYNLTHGKLNQSYLYGGPGMGYYDGPGGGPGLMARTLDLNFGLRVDHYGAVNMQTFVKIVDAVGGIDLYLEHDVDGRPIDDKTEDMGYFTAGQHHFTGIDALHFSRIRKKYNDLVRADNQNLVLCALKKKILTPGVLPHIPQLIASFQDSVQTDLSPEQIGQLACLLPQLKRENLIFTSLPQEILTPSRVFSPQQKDDTFVLDVDNAVIRDYVSRFMAGAWPDQPSEPSCP